MGCGPSQIPDTPEDLGYASVTFHWVDVLRMVHCDRRAQLLVKKAAQHYWPHGINTQIYTHGALDMELNSRPFVRGASRADLIASKKMSVGILEFLLADGWCVVVAADMSRLIDQSTWFLRKMPERAMGDKKSAQIMCFSFTGTEDLHLVKCNEKCFELIKEAIKQKYKPGTSDIQSYAENSHVIRLREHPWTSEGKIGMDARRLFLEVIRKLQAEDWHLYTAAGFHNTADCVYFIHHPDGNGWIKDKDAEFCMVSLNENDRLRLIDCDKETRKSVKRAIIEARGADQIQKEGEEYGTYEFKLKGMPWCAEVQDTVVSRYTILRVLEEMSGHGWHVVLTVDMSRKLNDKAVIILKKGKAQKRQIVCVQPGDVDRLRITNGNKEFIEKMREILSTHYLNGIQSENDNFYGAHEFKLKGMPWYGRQGMDEIFVQHLFCYLIKELDEFGYEVIAATDVSSKHIRSENGPDYPLDTHTWYFAKK